MVLALCHGLGRKVGTVAVGMQPRAECASVGLSTCPFLAGSRKRTGADIPDRATRGDRPRPPDTRRLWLRRKWNGMVAVPLNELGSGGKDHDG